MCGGDRGLCRPQTRFQSTVKCPKNKIGSHYGNSRQAKCLTGTIASFQSRLTNTLPPEISLFGLMLKALFGYHGHPSLTEVLAYLAYFGAIFFGLRWIDRPVKSLGTQAAESRMLQS